MSHKNIKLTSQTLSHNLKILRKSAGLSQEALANKLEIKRSSIAVYESKNVEPRLSVILEIARLFDIDIKTLVQEKLEPGQDYPSYSQSIKEIETIIPFHANLDMDVATLQQFIEKSMKIKKVLEGFKSFYDFKKDQMKEKTSPAQEKLSIDIENFLQLIEHLLNYNESVIKAIKTADKV